MLLHLFSHQTMQWLLGHQFENQFLPSLTANVSDLVISSEYSITLMANKNDLHIAKVSNESGDSIEIDCNHGTHPSVAIL